MLWALGKMLQDYKESDSPTMKFAWSLKKNQELSNIDFILFKHIQKKITCSLFFPILPFTAECLSISVTSQRLSGGVPDPLLTRARTTCQIYKRNNSQIIYNHISWFKIQSINMVKWLLKKPKKKKHNLYSKLAMNDPLTLALVSVTPTLIGSSDQIQVPTNQIIINEWYTELKLLFRKKAITLTLVMSKSIGCFPSTRSTNRPNITNKKHIELKLLSGNQAIFSHRLRAQW